VGKSEAYKHRYMKTCTLFDTIIIHKAVLSYFLYRLKPCVAAGCMC